MKPTVLGYGVTVQFGEHTRLLTEEPELRRMIEMHVSSLLEIFTQGPKPAVTVDAVPPLTKWWIASA